MKATIVVNFRERWSLTLTSLDSIFRNTPGCRDIWLLDTGMSESLRLEIARLYGERGLRIIDAGAGTWPNQARGMVAPSITTEYAVFIDNDVLVAPGWLDNLIRCAEETGAGIVGPLYLWGKDAATDLIHMAGGDLQITREAVGIVLRESHRHCMAKLSELPAEPVREVCGFAEYHCMLMRREVFSVPAVFDPEIVCVHEHIHASLIAREIGFETWLEPAARVNYLAFSPWQVGDLARFRRRWNMESGERSLQAFIKRWGVIDDRRSLGDVRNFLLTHVAHVDPIDSRGLAGRTRETRMQRSDLQQTLAGLIWLAQSSSYPADDIKALTDGYRLAMRLSKGMYRPCGRPFINHLAGTASVLIFYGFSIRMVLSGLLHSAYSHGATPKSESADSQITAAFSFLGEHGAAVARNARAYDERGKTYARLLKSTTDPAGLNLSMANMLLLEAANAIDMHMSLEVAASGRKDTPSGELFERMCSTARAVGLPALEATLVDTFRTTYRVPSVEFARQSPGSFYLGKQGLLSAVRR